MITEVQRKIVWDNMIFADVRAMYFGELASRYTRRTQIITGASLFLSSGAAATIAGKQPSWAPLIMAGLVAILNAYAISVGLDKSLRTMSELHLEWNRLNADYERLWSHLNDTELGYEEAEATLLELRKRGQDASQRAIELPLKEELLNKWEDCVYARYAPATTTQNTSPA